LSLTDSDARKEGGSHADGTKRLPNPSIPLKGAAKDGHILHDLVSFNVVFASGVIDSSFNLVLFTWVT